MDLQKFQSNNYHLFFTYDYWANVAFNLLKITIMRTTIFYENSFGIISQWTGEILEIKETTISIKLSPKKAYKFDLKANSEFLLVCKKKIKPLECLNSEFHKNNWISFDEDLRHKILSEIEKTGNIQNYWNGQKIFNH